MQKYPKLTMYEQQPDVHLGYTLDGRQGRHLSSVSIGLSHVFLDGFGPRFRPYLDTLGVVSQFSLAAQTMVVNFQGAHFPPAAILMGIRWYLAYPLSSRHVEELMKERRVEVDHSTINRSVIKYSPQLEEEFHRRKRRVWISWRMDETHVRVKGEWVYLYRAVDRYGNTIDFLLTDKRDQKASERFLTKAIGRNGTPETINIDKSGANTAAIVSDNAEHGTTITIRKNKCLHNIVEQDHRGVKRIIWPIMGFKSFDAAQATLTGIELMRGWCEGQLEDDELEDLTVAEQSYQLAA